MFCKAQMFLFVFITCIVLAFLIVLINNVLFHDVLLCVPPINLRRSLLAISASRRLFGRNRASILKMSSLLRRVSPSPSSRLCQFYRVLNLVLTSSSCWLDSLGMALPSAGFLRSSFSQGFRTEGLELFLRFEAL